ncbi:putative minor capsid protein [Lacticaseibacillus suilingensis]|uniref:putative minor capsid protein n=1 Tax=Lacticaseibacillus suilingensis TaxID=2799577 RepID=UPI0022E375F0|nr:putative minor capsid protein [Lacticaseibacillus suilingensis]
MAKDVDPIPFEALVDSIDVIEHHSGTSFDDDAKKVIHHFDRVLVQPADKSQVTGGSSDGAQLQHVGSYLVFVDAVNSVNADGYLIKLDDLVKWVGNSRRVVQVNPMKALLPTPHHWEVWLE